MEFYAFDAPNTRDEAKKNYRILTGKALHDFIYAQVGYDPNGFVPQVRRQFHGRVSLTYNAVPTGYFSVFKEIAEMIVTLGQAGLHIDSSFVPDGSVGGVWGKHWRDNNLDDIYVPRVEWVTIIRNTSRRRVQILSRPGAILRPRCQNLGDGCAKLHW